MDQAADADIQANKENKPALNKVKMLSDVTSHLAKLQLQSYFLDHDVLHTIRCWLEPLPDGSLPNINIRQGLLASLLRMPIENSHLKDSGIGKVVMFLWKHPNETKPNKKIAQSLIERWSRPIFGLSASYADLAENEENLHRPAKRPLNVTSRQMVSDASLDEDKKTSTPPKQSTIYHARIPKATGLDFMRRPISKVEETPKQTSTPTHVSKIKRHLQNLRQTKNRNTHAVKMSIEGRRC